MTKLPKLYSRPRGFIDDVDGVRIAEGTTHAIADEITHRCNCHEALVEALERLIRHSNDPSFGQHEDSEAWIQADKALALARETYAKGK